ncbi:MAG: hypothetical protein J7639_07450 [Paenibacillaceae bacterium]|nr:hypothetical protein [Paenibacillaceae bacterium]
MGSAAEITEHYQISRDGVSVTWQIEEAQGGTVTAVGVLVPLLVPNGIDVSDNSCEDHGIQLDDSGHRYQVQPEKDDQTIELELLPGLMPNRNGHYRLAQWISKGANQIKLHFELS